MNKKNLYTIQIAITIISVGFFEYNWIFYVKFGENAPETITRQCDEERNRYHHSTSSFKHLFVPVCCVVDIQCQPLRWDFSMTYSNVEITCTHFLKNPIFSNGISFNVIHVVIFFLICWRYVFFSILYNFVRQSYKNDCDQSLNRNSHRIWSALVRAHVCVCVFHSWMCRSDKFLFLYHINWRANCTDMANNGQVDILNRQHNNQFIIIPFN